MKTVIITGGNSGLGYHCAQQLAQDSELYLVLACRNLTKAEQAIAQIKAINHTAQLSAIELDLASLKAIRSFAQEVKTRNLPPLQGIICNAGVQFIQQQTYTVDGFESTFGINHLGHFLLVHLLLQQLEPPSRIVIVSSDTHDSSKKTGMPAPCWRDPQLMAYPQADPNLSNQKLGTLGRTAYTTSKLCNVLCAYEFDRQLQQLRDAGQSTTINVFNPGLMPGSGLAKDYKAIDQFVWRNILPWLTKFVPNVNTMEQAGTALARLITDSELEQVTGKYFSCLEMSESSAESYDEQKAQQLWQSSIELTKLKSAETLLNI